MGEKLIKEIQRRLEITARYGYVVGVKNERYNEHSPAISEEEAREHAVEIDKLYQSTNAELVAEVARLRGLGKGACILAKDIRDGKSIPENGIEDTLTALRIIK